MTCSDKIQVGQNSSEVVEDWYLYRTYEKLDDLETFLMSHFGHHLVFICREEEHIN